ncbi:PAS domain S-box-containing protein [Catalinimonas alkaloidigena]|uniref:histidine kinase n=1 Tax=Catalinimonas alkaloidigena TaxID=1075417 RepID=A0A1G8WC69_9BACT|nr:PAS domain S-box protein [Catalinimonas alkaloidigena]SDJ75365.1 PAS domain S-box-containing protein [Catalinimonas alkaloidigena]
MESAHRSPSVLPQREKIFRAMFEGSQESILVTNQNGMIVMVNPACERLFGYDSDEMVGQAVELLIPQRLRHQHQAHRQHYYDKPHARGMGRDMDLSARRKDGSEFYIEAGLNYVHLEGTMYVIAFIIDVTERKRTTDALRESRAQLKRNAEELEQRVEHRTAELARTNAELRETQALYHAMVQNFPDGIISVIDAAYRLVLLDGKALQELKLDRTALLHRPLLQDLPDDIRATVQLFLEKAFRGESATMEVEVQSKSFILNAAPLPSDDGPIRQVLVVGENITELKHAEEEMRNALKKERELNELKTRFVSMASHEFRTPLSTILSSTSLVRKYQDSTAENKAERISKHLDRIKSSVNDLVGVLDDFLSIGKLDEGKIHVQPALLDLQDLAQITAEEMQSVAKVGQVIRVEADDPRLTETMLDRKLIKAIFTNLLSNAIKYSAEGQRITLSLTPTPDAQVELRVQDQGIGIPEKEQKYLFNRFFRAGNATNIQGTGLGLHIVKRYVELQHGTIALESRANEGTTFIVRLPMELTPDEYETE